MCFICPVIGIHEPILRPGDPKLKDWIDDEEDKTREAIWNKIQKNMYKYYLGNNVEFASFRKAAEFLFNRARSKFLYQKCFLQKTLKLYFMKRKKLKNCLHL